MSSDVPGEVATAEQVVFPPDTTKWLGDAGDVPSVTVQVVAV
jgi:hypothetical protein